MSETKATNCIGCNKELTSKTILKHLSHKPFCKEKYSQTEINDIKQNSKSSAKLMEKAWKKADYSKNKAKYSEKRAKQYKKTKLESIYELFQRHHDNFHESRGKAIKEIASKNTDKEAQDKLLNIEEMVTITQRKIKENIDTTAKNFEITDYQKLFNEVCDEWISLKKNVDEMLVPFGVTFKCSFQEFLSRLKADTAHIEWMKCNSCKKTMPESSFLKHLAKLKNCKMKYEGSAELQSFKDKAAAKEKKRLNERYQNEKESRAKEYQDEKDNFEKQKRYDKYINAYEAIIPACDRETSNAMTLLEEWPTEKSHRGERCRREIQKFKAKGILEISQLMIDTEEMIDKKISELKMEVQEVATEVKDLVGHWGYDGTNKWKDAFHSDYDLIRNMLDQGVRYHVEQEMEDLYVSIIQILKDTGIKLGDEIQPIFSDIDLKHKFWYTRRGNGWEGIPRNVILK